MCIRDSYISLWFALPDRINRIRKLLEEKEKLGIEDFQKMHGDFKSKKAEEMVPEFFVALQTETNWNELEKAALKMLNNWDYYLTSESQAASIFEILYRKICENLIQDDAVSYTHL